MICSAISNPWKSAHASRSKQAFSSGRETNRMKRRRVQRTGNCGQYACKAPVYGVTASFTLS
jgi:hypothetical protein